MIKRNFSDAEWAKTPTTVKEDFINLEKWVLKLLGENKQLEERLNKAEVKVNKNSSNSSKPPSSDSPYKERPKKGNKKPKGKPGAKLGHKGHSQKMMEPTETIPVFPDECRCGGKEFKNNKPFYTHQEIELPEIRMQVTHFVLNESECVNCGQKVKATVPKEHRTGYGARLSALIGEMAGIQGNSQRTVKDFCNSVLKFDISLGAIQKVIYRISEAIKPHYQAIAKAAR